MCVNGLSSSPHEFISFFCSVQAMNASIARQTTAFLAWSNKGVGEENGASSEVN